MTGASWRREFLGIGFDTPAIFPEPVTRGVRAIIPEPARHPGLFYLHRSVILCRYMLPPALVTGARICRSSFHKTPALAVIDNFLNIAC
jgi:hypothetical protein